LTVTPIAFAERSGTHLHEPFLERASGDDEERGHALGAFLTLRLVDRIAEDAKALTSEALKFQLRACATYLDEVYPQTDEVTHLREIVRVAESASRAGNKRLLWAPLLAYAFWLEQQLRLDESLDVLDSTLRLENASAIDEKTAGLLQKGRVLREAGRFEEAGEAYAFAGELANLRGDLRSQMVSRIGRAGVLQKTGDLPGSESLLIGALHVAEQSADAFVEARALHNLSVTKYLMNKVPEAVGLAYRAYQRYEEADQRSRALSDVGVYLMELGHYGSAKEAFLQVLSTSPAARVRLNTVLELLEVSAHTQDRVGFERWRREVESDYDTLPPAERVDFEINTGWGLATFGNESEAKSRLERALGLAETYKLGQRVFEAEQLLNDLRAGRQFAASPPVGTAEIIPQLQAVVDSLQTASAG
jgi:tetratricopeptide (TPR) repeat protein